MVLLLLFRWSGGGSAAAVACLTWTGAKRQPAWGHVARPRSLHGVPGRFYVTTPIYYVNDAPHIGHALHDGRSPTPWPAGTACSATTSSSSPAPTSTASRSPSRPRRPGCTPQEQADLNSERFRATWDRLGIAYDDFIRTTEPRHHVGRAGSCSQRIKDNGDIELDTYEGAYCVSCEAYYQDGELVDGDFCPIHTGKPVTRLKEENWFFRLSRYEQRLLDWIEANPDGHHSPRASATRCSASSSQGLDDVSITRTSLELGRARAVGPGPRLLRLVRRPHQLRHGHRLRHRRRALRRPGGPTSTTSSARRSSASTACTGRRCCMAAGLEPPKRVQVHGWLLLGGEKLSKTVHGPAKLTDIAPLGWSTTSASTASATTSSATRPSGPTATSATSGWSTATTPTWPTTSATCWPGCRRWWARSATASARRRAPTARSPPSPPTRWRPPRRRGPTLQPSVALDATWRLVRETNAHLEANEPWKAEPGPEVDAVLGDALEALRIVSILASPAIPTSSAEIWRRIGLAGRPDEQRVPDAVAWGGYPGGLPVEKGTPLFPRIQPS